MSTRPGARSNGFWRALSFAAGLLLIGVGTIPVRASPARVGGCVTCLGPPTNTLWRGYVPLGGFTRHGKPLARSLRQQVLFIDTSDDSEGEALLWPLVKALDGFGSWTGVKPATQSCASGNLCLMPTFDLSHAIFRSRYVVLTTVYIAHDLRCNRRLPAEAVELLEHKRWRLGRTIYFAGKCWNPPANDYAAAATPLLLIGGYLQTGPQIVTYDDLMAPAANRGVTSWLPFAAVHDALAHNASTSQVTKGTLYDVNAEANLVEAFICHADKLQPGSTCTRPVITKLLQRIH